MQSINIDISKLLKVHSKNKLAGAETIRHHVSGNHISGYEYILEDLEMAYQNRLLDILKFVPSEKFHSLGHNLRAAYAHKHYNGTVHLYCCHDDFREKHDQLNEEVRNMAYEGYENEVMITPVENGIGMIGFSGNNEVILQQSYSVIPYDGIIQFIDVLQCFTQLEHALGVVIGEICGHAFVFSHDSPFPETIPSPSFKTPSIIKVKDSGIRDDQIWHYFLELNGKSMSRIKRG